MSDTRSPDEIRADIEHTREELADTAAALAEKADVKARAHDKVEETKARIADKVDETKAKVTGTASAAKEKASDATPESVATGRPAGCGHRHGQGQGEPDPGLAHRGLRRGGRRRLDRLVAPLASFGRRSATPIGQVLHMCVARTIRFARHHQPGGLRPCVLSLACGRPSRWSPRPPR